MKLENQTLFSTYSLGTFSFSIRVNGLNFCQIRRDQHRRINKTTDCKYFVIAKGYIVVSRGEFPPSLD